MNRKATHVPAYSCMTHLMTRGTFYDVGYNVGVSFNERIRFFFAESDKVQNKLLPFYDSRAGRDHYEESLRVCQDCFPQYVREVRGIADGAQLPFEHVFMANNSKEINNVLFDQWKKESAAGNGQGQHERNQPSGSSGNQEPVSQAATSREDDGQSESAQNTENKSSASQSSSTATPFQENYGCSDVFINRPGYQYVIHNEDCDPVIKPYWYLLSAEIEEDGMKEKFTSFTYPGILPGCAWSFNVHGLSLSIHGMYPNFVVQQSPSRLFVNRSLLRAKDITDAVRLAQNAPWGIAYGFCANISTKDGQMASVEVGPGKPQGLVHVYDVKQQSDPNAPCHYYHFNSYRHLLEVSEHKGLLSSTLRARRTEELPPPRTVQQALTVMADTKDPLGPIFRTPRPTDLVETACTAVYDVIARQVLVYQGREDLLNDKPFAKLPMYQ